MEESCQEQSPQQLKYLLNELEQPNTAVVALSEDIDLPDPLLYISEYKQVSVDDYFQKLFMSGFVAGYLGLLVRIRINAPCSKTPLYAKTG